MTDKTVRQAIDLGLERITVLLNLLGNPQHTLKIIHVAGTNGKGSVCAFVSTILKEANYHVGRFTSPYLIEPRDSVTMDLKPISQHQWDSLNQRIQNVIQKMEVQPTSFEVLTALAFLYFHEEQADFVVVEVGLGGSQDSTNVIHESLVSVITSIGYDHMNFLGNTIQSIASHKAGILKQGGTAVVGPQLSEAMQIIHSVISERHCDLVLVTPSTPHPSKEGHAISSNGLCYPLMLEGDIQLENSAIALAVIDVLKRKKVLITDEAVMDGMRKTVWPGRLEWKVHPTYGKVLLDGAHNEPGAVQLRHYVDTVLVKQKKKQVTWIFGATKGKNLEAVFSALLREGDVLYAVPFSTPEGMGWIRCYDGDEVLAVGEALVPKVRREKFESFQNAVEKSYELVDTHVTVIAGSLYLLRDVFRKKQVQLDSIDQILSTAKNDQLSIERLDHLLDQISRNESKGDPPSATVLEKNQILELLKFMVSPDHVVLVKTLKNLADAARIQKNRDMLGALKPMGTIIQFLNTAMTQNSQSDSSNIGIIHGCLRLLGNLCYDHPYNRENLQQVQGVTTIFECLKSQNEETQRIACGCIANIASLTEDICNELFTVGALDRLLELLKSPNDNVQAMSARALRNVCETEEIRLHCVSQGALDICVDIIKNVKNDDGLVLEFVGIVTMLVLTKTICYDFLYKHGGIGILLSALSNSKDVNLIVELQDFLSWISEKENYREVFLIQGHVPEIRNLYMDKNIRPEIRVCAGKIYANISASDTILGEMYKELDDFLALLRDEQKDVQVVAAMIIGNLARTDDNCLDMVQKGVAQVLISVIRDEEIDIRVRHYCTGTLRNLSINEKNKPVLLAGGIMEPLIKLLLQSKMNQVIVYQAVSVIKNLVLGGVEYWKAFIDGGGLEHLIKLNTFDESDHLKFESCRVVAMMAKEESLQKLVVSLGGVPALQILMNGKFDILKLEGAIAAKSLAENGYAKEVGLSPSMVAALLGVLCPPSQDAIVSPETKVMTLRALQVLVKTPEVAKHIYNEGGVEFLKKVTFGQIDKKKEVEELVAALEAVKDVEFPELDELTKKKKVEEKS